MIHGTSYEGAVVPQGWEKVTPGQEGKFGTQFTAIGDDWKYSNRDGENPWLPSPVYGEKDQARGCSRQEVQTVVVDGQIHSNSVCVEWNESTDEGEVINGLPSIETKPIENPDPNSPHHGKYIQFLCGASYPTATKDGVYIESDPGVGVGVLGSLHLGVKDDKPVGESNLFADRQTLIDSGAGVGSFFLICAPYSSVPFTSNWRFLNIGGNTIEPRFDTLGGSIAFSELRRALVAKNEARGAVREGKNEVYIRPPSFKTCPPGYLLSGLEFSRNETHLLGLEKLICVLPDGTAGNPDGTGNKLTVPTAAIPAQDYDQRLFGRRFSLTQMIGFPMEKDPECSGGTGDPLKCPTMVKATCKASHPIIRGLNIYHDFQGRLANVVPICVEKVIP
ncbi:hypothetical protein FRD01_02685 [Microvenator marinus]|uniref:Uncharacterized protein n=1 Tax=Microvenator marinus TaxID=2600177 RepID=A0A5B8XK54_9DELT|nr:hypothetical protein [Microvenator marinus]QED26182.1 hypothetical protein FRD01_02685 [Microvenator marinus]